ncbi:hypothetical protein [Listeria booriae]|uniref:hypothetical protein n=1 Tax=Listeria booriae TaxID=1552123 RepID=UPI00162796D0|nr:hypothetical protein [Listeria booriae]MBC2318794.1 hypothetical protein [Listeria booriae]
MNYKIAYEYDEKNVFLRDSIVFSRIIYTTADNKEFDEFSKAESHQRALFPIIEQEIERVTDSENLEEGVADGIWKETILIEPSNVPDIQVKETFILPSNCTWEPAPNPSNNAVWDEEKKKWINGEAPEMVPPRPSAVELLAQESADQLMHIAELEYKLDRSIQDNADLLMLISEVM